MSTARPPELLAEGTTIKAFPPCKTAYSVDVWTGTGGHGGGDPVLLNDLFGPNPPEDKYKRAADQRSGAYSILTGVAANHSMAGGKVIQIDDLVSGLELPDYPPMPTADDPIEMQKPDVQLVGAQQALKRKEEQAS